MYLCVVHIIGVVELHPCHSVFGYEGYDPVVVTLVQYQANNISVIMAAEVQDDSGQLWLRKKL